MNRGLLGLPEGRVQEAFLPGRSLHSGFSRQGPFGFPLAINDVRYRAEMLAEGPLLYWPLTEHYPEPPQDISGNGLHATAVTRPELVGNNAGPIDGSGAGMGANRAAVDSDLQDFTVEFWLYLLTQALAGQELFNESDIGGSTGFEISLAAGPRLLFDINDNDSRTSAGILVPGQWHHVAAVHRNWTWELYLNGQFDAHMVRTSVGFDYPTAAGGRSHSVHPGAVGCLLSHHAYFDRALDAETIKFHHDLGRNGWHRRSRTVRELPPTPLFKKELARIGATGDATLSWSADDLEAGDVILLFVESVRGEAATAPTGYAAVADSPQEPTIVGSTRLTVFWLRSDGTETGVTVADTGDHTTVVAHAYSGCVASGDPWDVTAGAASDTLDAAYNFPGDTTTVESTLVVLVGVSERDGDVAQFFSWASPDLLDLQGRSNWNHSQGGGGGIFVATGRKGSAGAFAASTATTVQTTREAAMAIALKP